MEMEDNTIVGLPTAPMPGTPIVKHPDKPREKARVCSVCNIKMSAAELKGHLVGKKHLNKVFKAKKQQYINQEGILVSGFSPFYNSIKEIFNYFKKYGRIIVVYMNDNWDEVLIQFANKLSAQSALKATNYLDCRQLKVRSRSYLQTVTNEDARSITVTVLENINKLLVPLGNQRLEEQINLLVSSMEITVEEKAERMRICRSLQNFLSISFPGCIFRPFGSVVAGLAFRGCDLDLRIENSQESGELGIKNRSVKFLSRVTRVLRTHPEVNSIFFVTTARVPVINLEFSGINCDITFHNPLGIQNSKLICFLLMLDTRVKPFLYIIKSWVKFCRLTGSSELSMSSYALSLMGVFYLQQLNPPILPSIEALQEHVPDEERQSYENWNIGFNSSFSFDTSQKNTSSILELVKGFFAFYGQLQPENKVLCPLVSAEIDREHFTSCDKLPPCMEPYAINVAAGMTELKMKQFTIQDPFELNFNPVANVQNYHEIQQTFMEAHQICQSILNKECGDGLASLFPWKPTHSKSTVSETQRKGSASISMKFKPTKSKPEKSISSFFTDLEVFFDRLFCWSYFISAAQVSTESPMKKQRRISSSKKSSTQEGQEQTQTLLEWDQMYVLDVPFDLWTSRNEVLQVINSNPESEKLSILDKERAVSSRIQSESQLATSKLFISLKFNMIYRVKSSVVVLSFEKMTDISQKRFLEFMKGLRYHLKGVMDKYLLEGQLPFSNTCCS